MASKFKKSGFTLLELLIALAIVGIIGVLIAGIFFAHSRLFSNQQTSVGVSEQNALALDEITGQIRQSQTVVTTCSSCGSYATGSNTLVLQAWPVDSQGSPIEPTASNYDYIIYTRDTSQNKLLKITFADVTSNRSSGTRTVIANVLDLVFDDGSGSFPADLGQVTQVRVKITTQATTTNKTHVITQEAKAVLRNK